MFIDVVIRTSIPIADVNLSAFEERHKSVDEKVLVAGTELDVLEVCCALQEVFELC